MTIKYNLFRKPGNLEEFFEKQKSSGKKEIGIGVFTRSEYEDMGFSSEHYKLVLGNSEKDIFVASEFSGTHGFAGAGNHRNAKSYLHQEVERVIEESKKRGFNTKPLNIEYKEKKTIQKLTSAGLCLAGCAGIACTLHFGEEFHKSLRALIIIPSIFGFFSGIGYPYFKDIESNIWESVPLPSIKPSNLEKEVEEPEKLIETPPIETDFINPWNPKIDKAIPKLRGKKEW